MNYIVTGAGRGIGFETALSLARFAGTRVICISRNEANLEKLKATALSQKLPAMILPIAADISLLSADDLRDFFSKNSITQIDGLVNNAGLLVNKPFEELTVDDVNRVYEVNVFAPIRLIQRLLPYIRKSEKPHIVNISSLGGFQGSSKFPGLSAYSSSKAALACLSECLASEFATHHISVNALAIGSVDTEMLKLAFPEYQAPVKAPEMGKYIADFVMNGHAVFNGKVLPVSLAGQ